MMTDFLNSLPSSSSSSPSSNPPSGSTTLTTPMASTAPTALSPFNSLSRNLSSLAYPIENLNDLEPLNPHTTSEVGMVLQLADGCIAACNADAERLMGMTADQMTGWRSTSEHWRVVRQDGTPFPGEEHPAMVALTTGKPCRDVTMGFYQPDGTLVWLLLNSQPMFQNGHDQPYAVLTTLMEVPQSAPVGGAYSIHETLPANGTDRPRATPPQGELSTAPFQVESALNLLIAENQALRDRTQRLQLALEGADLGWWDYDLEAHQLVWSTRCKTLFGAPAHAAVTYERFLDWVHPEDRMAIDQAIQQGIAAATDYDLEIRLPGEWERVEGEGDRWIRLKGNVYCNVDGKPARMVGIAMDITERKRMEETLRTARTEAETANRIKDELLMTLSHELRTPLNPILGWCRLLQTQELDSDKVSMAIATIERNAQRQCQVVEDLLDVAQLLRGAFHLQLTPVNLGQPMRAAIATVISAADAKRIRLEVEVGQGIPPIRGDATRLQQVIWNLLSNAVKFTPEGGRIVVRLNQVQKESQSLVQLQVIDTGVGINSAFLPHVFEHFRQADGTSTRQFGGLGLGLAIARHMVELHGGTIQVSSQGEGQGSTFTIQLPVTL